MGTIVSEGVAIGQATSAIGGMLESLALARRVIRRRA
jgi:hypothetical protein